MEFRIADTFTDSLAKLRNQEQKAVKIAALDLQLDPANSSYLLNGLSVAIDIAISKISGSSVLSVVTIAESCFWHGFQQFYAVIKCLETQNPYIASISSLSFD